MMSDQPTNNDNAATHDEIEPISGDAARVILHQAIRDHLGEMWDDEETGWAVVTGHDYMMRLTRGRKNLDFYVDLLGNVTIEEKEISSAQAQGRLLALILLFGSMGIAVFVAWLTGAF